MEGLRLSDTAVQEVADFPSSSQKEPVLNQVHVHVAGRTAMFLNNWKCITSDTFVLTCVQGVVLRFLTPPCMRAVPSDFPMKPSEQAIVDTEIGKLLSKGAIKEVMPVSGQFLSNIFVIPKKSGGFRTIINLKKLNWFLDTPHFKMENLLSFLLCIRQGMYMTSLDLTDAYFTLPIHEDFRKYLRFSWRGCLFEFQVLCFGLSPAPFIFTKVMKPVFTALRKAGICASYYIDDSIFANRDSEDLVAQTQHALELLESLGFVVNRQKSSLVPTTKIKHLGFIIDSVDMTVSLPQDKLDRLVASSSVLLKAPSVSVRQLAQFIGLIVSSFMGILHGQLHYRALEVFKSQCLLFDPSFERKVSLPEAVCEELLWWRDLCLYF